MNDFNNDTTPKNTGWHEWAQTILFNVNRLDSEVKTLDKELKKSIEALEKELKTQDNKIDDIKIILEEIKRITDKIDNLKEKIKDLERSLSDWIKIISLVKEDIAGLKVKAGIWGGLSGLLSALGAAIIYALTR